MISIILFTRISRNLIDLAVVTEINSRISAALARIDVRSHTSDLSISGASSDTTSSRPLPYPTISRNASPIHYQEEFLLSSFLPFVFLANPRRQSATHASRGWTGRASRALAKILQLAPRRARRSSRTPDAGSRKK